MKGGAARQTRFIRHTVAGAARANSAAEAERWRSRITPSPSLRVAVSALSAVVPAPWPSRCPTASVSVPDHGDPTVIGAVERPVRPYR